MHGKLDCLCPCVVLQKSLMPNCLYMCINALYACHLILEMLDVIKFPNHVYSSY